MVEIFNKSYVKDLECVIKKVKGVIKILLSPRMNSRVFNLLS